MSPGQVPLSRTQVSPFMPGNHFGSLGLSFSCGFPRGNHKTSEQHWRKLSSETSCHLPMFVKEPFSSSAAAPRLDPAGTQLTWAQDTQFLPPFPASVGVKAGTQAVVGHPGCLPGSAPMLSCPSLGDTSRSEVHPLHLGTARYKAGRKYSWVCRNHPGFLLGVKGRVFSTAR